MPKPNTLRQQVREDTERAINRRLEQQQLTEEAVDRALEEWETDSYEEFFADCRQAGEDTSRCGALWTRLKEMGDVPTDEGGDVDPGNDEAPAAAEPALPVPETVEGVSWFDHLADGAAPPRASAFAQYTDGMKRDNESRCVITNDRHLIRYFDQGRTVEYPVAADPGAFAAHEERLPTAGARPFAQLYDVETDPYELDDIGSDSSHGETVERLSARLLQWMVDVDDPLLEGRVRLPYYERAIDDLLTRSARDG